MASLYVDGQKVEWEDAERVLNEPFAMSRDIEVRAEDGRVIGWFEPVPIIAQEAGPGGMNPETCRRFIAQGAGPDDVILCWR